MFSTWAVIFVEVVTVLACTIKLGMYVTEHDQ